MGTTNCSGCNCQKESESDEILVVDKNKRKNPNTSIASTSNLRDTNNAGNPTDSLHQGEFFKENHLCHVMKENIVMMKDNSKSDLFNSRQEIESVEKSKKTSLPISPLHQPTATFLEQSLSQKLNFGISNQELSFDQQKLLFETQKNLNQFFQPQPAELKVIETKLSKIPLTSIVPEYKLISQLPDNEVIFNGQLRKLINYEIKSHKPQLYSARFCTLTKTTFSYYKSVETFLTLNKPLCQVPINQITKIFFIKTKQSSKKIDHIIICNKLGIIKDKREFSKNKIFEPYEQNALENNESLLIFASDVEETLYKWYLILDYFLKKEMNSGN